MGGEIRGRGDESFQFVYTIQITEGRESSEDSLLLVYTVTNELVSTRKGCLAQGVAGPLRHHGGIFIPIFSHILNIT